MARLILVNGPPGCGKSTMATMYVANHPLALNLDIDRVRSLLGAWLDQPGEAGMLARQLALAMGSSHLRAGHDVVIPQFLGRLPFIEQVEDLARRVGAGFHEIVLMYSKENLLRRFTERSGAGLEPTHTDAEALLERSGGLPLLAEMYDALLAVLTMRPNAKVIRADDGQAARTYRDLMDHLDSDPVG